MKKADRCPTCKRKKRRSNPANARYWLLLHVIADKAQPEGKSFSADTWHCYFKQRFLGCEEIQLPNKKVIQQPNSSADLDQDAFNDYMLKVEQWAMSHDIYLEEMAA